MSSIVDWTSCQHGVGLCLMGIPQRPRARPGFMPSATSLQLVFIPVLYAMIEVRLKLIVTHTARYLDEPTYLSVVHDPLLDQNRLVEPASELRERAWRRHNDTPAPPSIFRSERAEDLLEIPLRLESSDDRLLIIVLDEGEPLAFDGRLVEHVDYNLLGHGNEALRAVLDAALLLPTWDRQAKSRSLSDQATVTLCVSERMALRLIKDPSCSSSRIRPNQVVMGERAVRAE